jgi:hypothetical protein
MKKLNHYIWTEGINCEKILYHALKSFDIHHKNFEINVFVGSSFNKSEGFDNFINNNFTFHKVSKSIEKKFKYGHLGTATLWTKIIQEINSENFIHFDSDVIFLGEIINHITEKLNYHDVVGPIRSYKFNPQNDDYFRKFNDTCSTCLFGFKKSKISKKYLVKNNDKILNKIYLIFMNIFKFKVSDLKISVKNLFKKNNDILTDMILSYNPLGHKVLDAFDPVVFDIFSNGGTIDFLDFNLVGGSNSIGERKNRYPKLNDMPEKFKIEYGSKFLHFSSVGSGLYYSENINEIKVPSSYINYAVDRYNFYKYMVELDDKVLNNEKYHYFKNYTYLRKYFNYKKN